MATSPITRDTDVAHRQGTRPDDPLEDLAPVVRVILASLLLGAGVIHLVMVPSHAQASSLDGWGFAIVGWLQVLSAVALLVRPGRALLGAVVGINLVVIGGWIVSRTVGLPVGGHKGVVEAVGGVDLLTVGLEAAVIVGALLVLWRPALGRDLPQASLVVASAIPVLVLVATSVAVSDPSVSEHGHDESASSAELAAAGTSRCDLGFNPAAYWTEGAVTGVASAANAAATPTPAPAESTGHSHGAAAAPTAAATPTTTLPVIGSPELDELVRATTSTGDEVKDAAIIVALANASDDAYDNWLRWLPQFTAAAHATGAATDMSHGAHVGPQTWTPMTDEAQCDQLDTEITLARDTALTYPTAADAKAAGYRQVTTYIPGIASHWMNFGYVDDTFEIAKPEMILYDGDGEDAHVVGLSYFLLHGSTFQPTQGFAGENDSFHRHDGLCIQDAKVALGSGSTEEECTALGGFKLNGVFGWMNHAWVVPGCESPWGVFSGASPTLDDDLAAASGHNDGGCSASGVRDRYDLSPGSPANTATTSIGLTETAAATGN